MINKNILENNLLGKFRNLTLHSVVNTCFLNGLPLTKSELNKSDVKNLSKYSLTVLESVGGFDIAKESLSALTDAKQKSFLSNILSICEEAALEATKRTVKETDAKKPEKDMKDIVDKAAFTEEEYNKFKSKVGDIELNEISDIINEKTLNVIKNEKEIQEQDEEMKNKLQEALADSKNFNEISVESYMDLVLKKDNIRTPVTFFSKLMDVAYENLLYAKESDSELLMDVIHRVTFDGTLKTFKRDKTPLECFESLVNVNSAPMEEMTVTDDSKEKMMNKSLVCSIVIYTILETLKTLNIYSPSINEIESFIRNTPKVSDILAKDKEDFINHFNNNINSIRCFCAKSVATESLVETRNKLLDMKDKISIDIFNDTAYVNAKEELLVSIESLVDDITIKLNNLESGLNQNVELSYYDKRALESDIAGLNKINSLYGSHANISDIYLAFDPASEALSNLDIICKNSNGDVVNKSFVPMSFKADNNENHIRDTFKKSKLNTSQKNIHILYNNGTGKSYKIN